MSPDLAEVIKTALITLFGAGGTLAAVLTYKTKNKEPLPREKVQQAEAVHAIESSGLVGEWRSINEGLKEQNKLLRSQNDSLLKQVAALNRQNSVLVAQNTLLRETHSSDTVQRVRALAYITELRDHINAGRNPPAPPWPDGLEAL